MAAVNAGDVVTRVDELRAAGESAQALALIEAEGATNPRLLSRAADLLLRQGDGAAAQERLRRAVRGLADASELLPAVALATKLDRADTSRGLIDALQHYIGSAPSDRHGVSFASLLADLPAADLSGLLAEGTPRRLARGERLLDGGLGGPLVLILRGRARLHASRKEGGAAVVSRLEPGAWVDGAGLVAPGKDPAWVTATSQLLVLELPIEPIEDLAREHRAVGAALARGRRLRVVERLLADQATLRPLSSLVRKALAVEMEEQRIRASNLVFQEGDASDHLYLVLRGRVEVFTHDGDGAELPLAELGPGDMFGEAAALNRTRRTASVRAKTDVILQRLSCDVMEARLADQPQAIAKLKGMFRERVADTLNRLDAESA